MEQRPQVTIYTDGGADPNPGAGGWGAILIDESSGRSREISGGVPDSTNNQMELTAAIRALESLKKPCIVTLYTDSQYLRQGITEWIDNWKRNGWKTAAKKPVKNEDLWRQLDTQMGIHNVSFHWVKGHAGHPENERADDLARAAAEAV